MCVDCEQTSAIHFMLHIATMVACCFQRGFHVYVYFAMTCVAIIISNKKHATNATFGLEISADGNTSEAMTFYMLHDI